ncbi:MarR family winged helix-turn-helix transcriptional regulator [Methanorbis furvi]|uniref:HTH marR-type domain-containing protein n=1 Tax=Methanorbis furvi TaxID=3028299 RepID=A0AAE4MCJ6_9EURY|nr:hypothetical protein [Methanocorpusculaceae archaeon Ag1]
MDPQPPVIIEIKKLANQIKRQLHNSDSFSKCENLTGVQGWIIGYLHHQEKDIFQKDIEEQLEVRRSTASGILQLMEKNGLIIREPVPYDARLKKLILTEKAKDIHRRVAGEMNRIDSRLTRGLTSEELTLFCSVIARMQKNLAGDNP